MNMAVDSNSPWHKPVADTVKKLEAKKTTKYPLEVLDAPQEIYVTTCSLGNDSAARWLTAKRQFPELKIRLEKHVRPSGNSVVRVYITLPGAIEEARKTIATLRKHDDASAG